MSALNKYTRRDFLKIAAAIAGTTAIGSIIQACAPPTPTAISATAVPTATGKVAIYSALDASTNNQLFAAFKTANAGLDVQLLPLAAGELQTRIRKEKASPKADIFVGGDRSFHDGLGKEGLLEAYKSPNAANIAADQKAADGFWTGWYLGVFSFGLNADRFGKEMTGVKKPSSWDDLLDPAWKGKLILPDPIKTSVGFIFLATQVFRFAREEAKAMNFMKKLNGNIAQYVGTAPKGIQLVAQGQFVGCPNWGHDILTEKAKGSPIDLIVPENTGYEVGAVSIVKGAPNLAGAQAFVDWILTKPAGELNVKLSNRFSVLKDVPPAPGAPALEQIKFVNYDWQWAADNKDRLLKAWQKAIG